MAGTAMRKILGLALWAGLLILLLLLGHMALKACGVRLLGYEFSWCAAQQDMSSLPRLQALREEMQSLEGQLADRSCPANPPPLTPSTKGVLPPADLAMKPVDLAPPPASPSVVPPAVPPAVVPPATPIVPPPTGAPPPSPQIEAISCPPGESPKPYIVLALDHSKSMGLPNDIKESEAVRLESLMARGGVAGNLAARIYNAYVDAPGHKRIDVLKGSVRELSERTDHRVNFGVVSFSGCEGVVDLGDYVFDRRERMVQKVDRLNPDTSTPAAKALQIAIDKAARHKGGRVVLVSDGKDTCGGDPCAVARNSQGVQIDVIAMAGGDVMSCVARSTSGKMVTPTQNQSLEDILLQLGATADEKTCQ